MFGPIRLRRRGSRARDASFIPPLVLSVLLLVAALVPGLAEARGWTRLDASAIQGLKLFDLGVVDYDGDGNLDVFTTNHKFDSSLLHGDGLGGLTESRVQAGLSPTQDFPGFESLRRTPDTSTPGVYLFATTRPEPRDPFQIRTTDIPASGTLTFTAEDLQVERSDNAISSVGSTPEGLPTLTFAADPGAAIDVTVTHLDLPIEVTIDPPTPPGEVKVGADAVPASSRSFELNLRDRHGFGFADFNGDGLRDLFIATGGLGGEILDPFFTGRQSDELLLARPDAGYLTSIAGSGLIKGTCRGRGVDVADFDGDGDLDIFEACEGDAPRVYIGDGTGHFTSGPAPPAPASTYRVIDLQGDRRPEVVAASGDRLGVWRISAGTWSLAQELPMLNGESPIEHIALGDYDNDGDLDLFAASPGGNTMVRNVDGLLRRRDPELLNLPLKRSYAASFVDYDNDGDLDLSLMPQGIQKSKGASEGSFKRTGKLGFGPLPDGRIKFATVSWPDLDGDGRRDVISARGRGEFAAEQLIDARLNGSRDRHWLQVDLVGPAGNRDAIGASVRVQTADGRSYGWVGQSEDSRESAGHYRLYWGLGDESRIERLVIRWPDGTSSKRSGIRADRLLTIRHP